MTRINPFSRLATVAPLAATAFLCGSVMAAQAQENRPTWCGSQSSLNLAEQTICSTRSLWNLDGQLTLIYDGALNDVGSEKARLEASEKRWIASRDACGINVVCLTDKYQSRIEQVRNIDNRGHMNPADD
jgi:uncharacterized protein